MCMLHVVPHIHCLYMCCRGSVSLLTCLKNALRLFVYNKSVMNPDHEFALVVLTDQANWVNMYSNQETYLLYVCMQTALSVCFFLSKCTIICLIVMFHAHRKLYTSSVYTHITKFNVCLCGHVMCPL